VNGRVCSVVTRRKVTGYSPAIPHAQPRNETPPLKNYQPMDMSGQRTRIPVVAGPQVLAHAFYRPRVSIKSHIRMMPEWIFCLSLCVCHTECLMWLWCFVKV